MRSFVWYSEYWLVHQRFQSSESGTGSTNTKIKRIEGTIYTKSPESAGNLVYNADNRTHTADASILRIRTDSEHESADAMDESDFGQWSA